MDKLKNFPSIRFLTLEESEERRNDLLFQLNKYGITNYKPIFCYNGRTQVYNIAHPLVEGQYVHQIESDAVATSMSHMKAIQDWYTTTEEEYGFFCEDDIKLDMIDYWNFSWEELISSVPNDWKVLQLALIRTNEMSDADMMPHTKKWDDWSCCAYVVNRAYAQQILSDYYDGVKFTFDIKGTNHVPLAENLVYPSNYQQCYVIPIFTENRKYVSTLNRQDNNSHKTVQDESSKFIIDWWNNKGKFMKIGDIFNMEQWFLKEEDNTQQHIPEPEQKLSVNPEYELSKRAIIVDNFYKDPFAVREYALQQEYFDDPGYIGRRTRTQHFLPGVKEAFEKLIGEKITNWESYGMNGRFQHNFAGEQLVYHCDDQKWAAMIYLTPDAPPQCGTSTYMHRGSRVHHIKSPRIMEAFNQKTFLDKTPYDTVDVFGNIFNRLVIFDGGCIHAASEYFGSDLYDCRLWHMFFFDTEGEKR
jgi:hypothetical protein